MEEKEEEDVDDVKEEQDENAEWQEIWNDEKEGNDYQKDR